LKNKEFETMTDKSQPQVDAAEETLEMAEDFAPDAFAVPENDALTVAIRERDEWRDKAYRAAADAENVKRRSAQEIADARQYAVTKFAADVLGVGDNLARALTAPEGNEKALRDGILMVATQLQTMLGRYGIAPIVVKPGDVLDANLHQAMTEAPTNDVAPGHIVQEMQAGFTINGRLLRPAMVVVATPLEDAA
jgi:molecular chaperone GrpE